MAMRNYGVQSKCMVLNLKEFYDLCINHRKYVNDEIEEHFSYLYDEQPNKPLVYEEIELSDLLDLTYIINFACAYMEIDGTLRLFKEDLKYDYKYFDNEDIVIFELEKDTLFDSYKDYEEIYNELINTFAKVGITIDKQYIEEHLGDFEGSYYC